MSRAISAARRAFDETDWPTNRALRRRCLEQLQEAIEAEREEMRAELVAEVGTPVMVTYSAQLDAPLAELSLSLENESLRSLPENLRGKCCAPLRELDESQLAGLLRQAARVRFENKAAQYRARAKNAGWEQTLWENLFRALGYK